MLSLVPLESYNIFIPLLLNPFLKISSFSCLIIDYKLFRGHFLLSHFSVNDSCYGSDRRSPLHSNLYTVKKSAQFFNLTLHTLMNLEEKFYQCIHFGARCKFEHNRGTAFGHLVFTEDYFYSRMPSFALPSLLLQESLTEKGLNKK
jgi:hypothetical protein